MRPVKLAGVVILCATALLFVYMWFRRSHSPHSPQQITLMSPSSILFSLPTISDIGPLTARMTKPSPDAIRMHEDDWRQIEFVAVEALPMVERELAELEAFKRINWTGAGWKNVYVRKSRPDALRPKGISYADLLASIPHGPVRDIMIGTTGHETWVKDGFVFSISGMQFLYGDHREGKLVTLALARRSAPGVQPIPLDVVALCNKFRLIVVDWEACRVIAGRQPTSTNGPGK